MELKNKALVTGVTAAGPGRWALALSFRRGFAPGTCYLGAIRPGVEAKALRGQSKPALLLAITTSNR